MKRNLVKFIALSYTPSREKQNLHIELTSTINCLKNYQNDKSTLFKKLNIHEAI